MGDLNRSAVILRAKQAFLDWRNAFELKEGRKGYTLEEIRDDPKVYLVFGFKTVEPVRETVMEEFDIYFADQLVDTVTSEEEWPKNRTVEMFKEWFDIEVFTTVDDVEDQVDIEEEL